VFSERLRQLLFFQMPLESPFTPWWRWPTLPTRLGLARDRERKAAQLETSLAQARL
jgi:hypothetical protein